METFYITGYIVLLILGAIGVVILTVNRYNVTMAKIKEIETMADEIVATSERISKMIDEMEKKGKSEG